MTRIRTSVDVADVVIETELGDEQSVAVRLTPKEARRLAASLWQAAEIAGPASHLDTLAVAS